MERIGFFGGTFDPIHLGHINLALQIFETCNLDHILFCPARCSPDKKNDPPQIDFTTRAQMIALAIADIPHFSLTTIEEKHEGLSYTIDTIEYLKSVSKKYENSSLFLILAEDAIKTLYQWKSVTKLCQIAPPLIGQRKEDKIDLQHYPNQELIPFIQKGLIKTKTMEISSTDIRERIKKKLYCGHLLPSKVLDFISRHGLYC